ncbi:unnamed protein product [Colias eurytheme]|nr:unnamed protein product [Colias eurytheme]
MLAWSARRSSAGAGAACGPVQPAQLAPPELSADETSDHEVKSALLTGTAAVVRRRRAVIIKRTKITFKVSSLLRIKVSEF